MKTILFDLDDTLIESMHVWEDAIIRLFKKMDLYMSMEEARQIFFTMKFSEVLTYIKERFHTKQDEAIVVINIVQQPLWLVYHPRFIPSIIYQHIIFYQKVLD